MSLTNKSRSVSAETLRLATQQAKLSNTRVNIYQLPSGTMIIAPAGYDIPDKAILVGYVNRDGQYITDTNTDRIQDGHQK